MLVMPFFTARTPDRRGVVFSLRLRAAAGPVVRAGRPEEGWLNRLCLLRGGAVVHPYMTPRVAVSGRRRGRAATAQGRGRARRIGRRGGIFEGGVSTAAVTLSRRAIGPPWVGY